jgi:hypothetical protein
MDRENINEDTGKIELERILECLKKNNYEFEDLEQSYMYGYMIANFKKDIKYSDKNGNYINDRYIKIKIEFDSDFDYQNEYNDKKGDYNFDSSKGIAFITNIFNSTYDKK